MPETSNVFLGKRSRYLGDSTRVEKKVSLGLPNRREQTANEEMDKGGGLKKGTDVIRMIFFPLILI